MIQKITHVQFTETEEGVKETKRWIEEKEIPNPTPEEIQREIEKKRIEQTKEYQLLNEMIDELEDTGVDVSYFPERAKEVLRRYSQQIKI